MEREGAQGLSARNLKNFRQVVLTWPDLDPRQALFAVLGPMRQTASAGSPEFRQTPSADSALVHGTAEFPSLNARITALQRLPWQDQAWTERLFASVTFSHLLELSRIDQPLARAVFVSRYLTALPSEEQLTRWLHEERLRLARARRGAS